MCGGQRTLFRVLPSLYLVPSQDVTCHTSPDELPSELPGCFLLDTHLTAGMLGLQMYTMAFFTLVLGTQTRVHIDMTSALGTALLLHRALLYVEMISLSYYLGLGWYTALIESRLPL